jgi:hypothetical protein
MFRCGISLTVMRLHPSVLPSPSFAPARCARAAPDRPRARVALDLRSDLVGLADRGLSALTTLYIYDIYVSPASGSFRRWAKLPKSYRDIFGLDRL